MTKKLASQLQARLAELTGEIAALAAERSHALPADFAEQAEVLENRDALDGIENVHLAEITAIRATLARIAAGRYGRCAQCGCAIDPARLAALPTATICIACSC